MRHAWVKAVVGGATLGLVVAAAPLAQGLPLLETQQGTSVGCFYQDDELYLDMGGFFDPTGTLLWGGAFAVTRDGEVFSEDASGSYSAGDFSLDVLMLDEQGGDAGTVAVDAVMSRVGDLVVLDERYRDGNAWTDIEGTLQELAGDGEITSTSGVMNAFAGVPLTCSGTEVDVTVRGSTPATVISRSTWAGAFCPLGEDGYVSVDVWGDEAFGSVVTGLDWDTGEADFVAEGMLAYDGTDITGDLPVVHPPVEPPDVVAVDLTVGDRLDEGRYRDKNRQGALHVRFVTWLLTGSVTLPGGEQVAIDDCVFTTSDVMERFSARAGQKPGGKPPVNDLPGDALPIEPAATVATSTRGAVEEPEATCAVDGGDEMWDVPLGRTVWYSFTGTGDEVALSTVGSGFDTVLGVYDGLLGQVACVDDTEETGLQAAVTVETEPGQAYLVQVGGFAGEWGRLVLSRD